MLERSMMRREKQPIGLALLHSYSPLSHLKLFYTAISRARDEVQLIVDDAKELTGIITKQTGEKTRALLDSELKWHVGIVKKYTHETEKSATKKSWKTAIDEFDVGKPSERSKPKSHELFIKDTLKPQEGLKSKNQEMEL